MLGSTDGFGLASWARTSRPNIKVILTSGVAHSAELAQDICEDGAIEAKPYHFQLLVERIKKALAQVSRAGNEPLPSGELVASSADSPVRDKLMGFPLEACSTTPAEATKKLRLLGQLIELMSPALCSKTQGPADTHRAPSAGGDRAFGQGSGADRTAHPAGPSTACGDGRLDRSFDGLRPNQARARILPGPAPLLSLLDHSSVLKSLSACILDGRFSGRK